MRQKTIITKLLQSVTDVYYKVRPSGITKCDRLLLQSATVLTKWDVTYPLIYNLSSLNGIVESKNVSGKQMMPMLFASINASKVTLTKSWAAIPLRFQWQKFSLEDFLGPGLISMSLDCSNSKWCKLKEYMTRIQRIKSNSFDHFKRKNSLIIKKETERTVH